MRRVARGKYGAEVFRTWLYGSLALFCAALACGISPSSAQDAAAASTNNIPSSGEISPTGAYQAGVPVGAWMLYPSLFVGATYNNNINQAATDFNRDNGAGLRVAPRLIATGTDGAIHQTTIYAVGDFQFFNANTVAADARLLAQLQADARPHVQW